MTHSMRCSTNTRQSSVTYICYEDIGYILLTVHIFVETKYTKYSCSLDLSNHHHGCGGKIYCSSKAFSIWEISTRFSANVFVHLQENILLRFLWAFFGSLSMYGGILKVFVSHAVKLWLKSAFLQPPKYLVSILKCLIKNYFIMSWPNIYFMLKLFVRSGSLVEG